MLYAAGLAALVLTCSRLQTTESSLTSLRQVIVLSRHGVRGPYGLHTHEVDEADIALHIQNLDFRFPYSGSEWGTLWDGGSENATVGPKLTHHGYQAIRHMGEYFRNHLYADFLDATSCEDAIAYSDEDQRDNLTARAFMESMSPECGEVAPVTDNVTLLFNQGGNELYDMCPVASLKVYEGIVGGNTSQYVLQEVQSEVQELSDLLGCCSPSVCEWNETETSGGSESKCDLFGIPSEWKGDYWRPWADTLSTAGYFSEVLLSMALNNMTMPTSSLTLEKIVQLSRIHDIHIQLVSNEVNAANFGGTLLTHLAASFEQCITGRPIYVADGEGPQFVQGPENRFLYYAAHDINLMFVRNMLNLEWFTKGWHPQQPVVGGMLVFELHSTPDSRSEADFYVKLYFMSATPEQIRDLDKLTPENPPNRASVAIPLCSQEVTLGNGETELRCPFAAFKQLLGRTLRRECIADTLRPFADSMSSTE